MFFYLFLCCWLIIETVTIITVNQIRSLLGIIATYRDSYQPFIDYRIFQNIGFMNNFIISLPIVHNNGANQTRFKYFIGPVLCIKEGFCCIFFRAVILRRYAENRVFGNWYWSTSEPAVGFLIRFYSIQITPPWAQIFSVGLHVLFFIRCRHDSCFLTELFFCRNILGKHHRIFFVFHLQL